MASIPKAQVPARCSKDTEILYRAPSPLDYEKKVLAKERLLWASHLKYTRKEIEKYKHSIPTKGTIIHIYDEDKILCGDGITELNALPVLSDNTLTKHNKDNFTTAAYKCKLCEERSYSLTGFEVTLRVTGDGHDNTELRFIIPIQQKDNLIDPHLTVKNTKLKMSYFRRNDKIQLNLGDPCLLFIDFRKAIIYACGLPDKNTTIFARDLVIVVKHIQPIIRYNDDKKCLLLPLNNTKVSEQEVVIMALQHNTAKLEAAVKNPTKAPDLSDAVSDTPSPLISEDPVKITPVVQIYNHPPSTNTTDKTEICVNTDDIDVSSIVQDVKEVHIRREPVDFSVPTLSDDGAIPPECIPNTPIVRKSPKTEEQIRGILSIAIAKIKKTTLTENKFDKLLAFVKENVGDEIYETYSPKLKALYDTTLKEKAKEKEASRTFPDAYYKLCPRELQRDIDWGFNHSWSTGVCSTIRMAISEIYTETEPDVLHKLYKHFRETLSVISSLNNHNYTLRILRKVYTERLDQLEKQKQRKQAKAKRPPHLIRSDLTEFTVRPRFTVTLGNEALSELDTRNAIIEYLDPKAHADSLFVSMFTRFETSYQKSSDISGKIFIHAGHVRGYFTYETKNFQLFRSSTGQLIFIGKLIGIDNEEILVAIPSVKQDYPCELYILDKLSLHEINIFYMRHTSCRKLTFSEYGICKGKINPHTTICTTDIDTKDVFSGFTELHLNLFCKENYWVQSIPVNKYQYTLLK